MAAFESEIADLAVEELTQIRAFDRRRIVEAIRNQLTYQPTVTTRNCKQLEVLAPNFEHTPPIWELRVDDYRLFYDVDEDNQMVYVRAVRQKLSQQTTEDITQ